MKTRKLIFKEAVAGELAEWQSASFCEAKLGSSMIAKQASNVGKKIAARFFFV